MAVDVASSDQGTCYSNSGPSFLDASCFCEAAVLNAKQGAETKSPLQKVRSLDSQRTIVDTESDSIVVVENRCLRDGQDVSSGADVGSVCSRIAVQEDMDTESSELKRMFRTFDDNQDGLICAVDVRRFMGRLGLEIAQEEAVSMLATVDHNGDGYVGFEEFCTLYRSLDGSTDSSTAAAGEKRADEEEDETLVEAFRVFDKNKDGFISCQELQAVLLALGLPEGKSLKSCQRMIDGVDSDGNGEVDLEEFKQMMSTVSLSI